MTQCEKIKQIWAWIENFDDICFFYFFDRYYRFYFWKKEWALRSAPNHF